MQQLPHSHSGMFPSLSQHVLQDILRHVILRLPSLQHLQMGLTRDAKPAADGCAGRGYFDLLFLFIGCFDDVDAFFFTSMP